MRQAVMITDVVFTGSYSKITRVLFEGRACSINMRSFA